MMLLELLTIPLICLNFQFKGPIPDLKITIAYYDRVYVMKHNLDY